MAQELVTFQDIYTAVSEEIGVPTSDTTTINRIKRNINMIYLNEIIPAAKWPWMFERADINHAVQVNNDGALTASVTQGSTTVTMSATVATSQAGKFFKSVHDEVYTISAHTAGSDTLTLSAEYTGATSSSTGFKIWTDKISLPQDAAEVVDMYHDYHSKGMIPRGPQKLNELSRIQFDLSDYPRYYATEAFENGATEALRNRFTRIWPARYDKDITLHVMYKKEATALDSDSDEPIIPLEDRIILFYGAAWMSWKRETDNADSTSSYNLYQKKLDDMIARWADATDMPQLEMDDRYTSWRRNAAGKPAGWSNG